MQLLTHNPTKNSSTNVHGNQQSIYDINIQLQELYKGMLIANILKGKLNSQQPTNASWLVTTIKAMLKTLIQNFVNTIFSFRITHEEVVRNRKILATIKGDFGAAITVQKYSPVNYGSEFCDIAFLANIFLHHEETTKFINTIQEGSR